jgi:predicted nucleotide-binding protein
MGSLGQSIIKLKAIRKAVKSVLDDGPQPPLRQIQQFPQGHMGKYFHDARTELDALQVLLPEMFEEFPMFSTDASVKMTRQGKMGPPLPNQYSRAQVQNLLREVDRMIDIATESTPPATRSLVCAPRRVFITHGRAGDWLEVQAYIEKDCGLQTLELAQQANLGRTIMEKLQTEADKCDSAVIVMTGDDIDDSGQLRARQNVIHEIGYFQGRFGSDRVALLYEEGVTIPSNIHGVVYLPFPKRSIKTCFSDLARELRALYPPEPA